MLLILSVSAFILSLAAFLLAVLPRTYTRRIRHPVARLILWQWRKMSLVSVYLYAFFWQHGNGKEKRLKDD